MAVTVTHTFNCPLADDPKAAANNEVLISHWNANHTISGTTLRTVLTADTTYNVSTTGSDTTGDGSAGNPWATLQHACDYISDKIDLAGYNVFIQCADGTYVGVVMNQFFSSRTGDPNSTSSFAFLGSPNVPIVQIKGNAADASKVVIGEVNSFYRNTNAFAGCCVACSSQPYAAAGIINLTIDASALSVTNQPVLINDAAYFAVNDNNSNFNPIGTVRFVNSGANDAGHAIGTNGLNANAFVTGTVDVIGGTWQSLLYGINLSLTDVYACSFNFSGTPSIRRLIEAGSEIGGVSSYGFVRLRTNCTFTGAVTVTAAAASITGPNSWLDVSQGTSGFNPFPSGNIVVSRGGTYSYNDVSGNWHSITGASTAGSQFDMLAVQKAGAPSTTDLSTGSWNLFKDTSGGTVTASYNDAGTIKSVTLSTVSGITINATTITSGTNTRLLYDNSATVGETSHITINDSGSFAPPIMQFTGGDGYVGTRLNSTTTSQLWDISQDGTNLVFVDRINNIETFRLFPGGGFDVGHSGGTIFSCDNTGLLTIIKPVTVTPSTGGDAFHAECLTATDDIGYRWELNTSGGSPFFRTVCYMVGTAGSVGVDSQQGDLVFRPFDANSAYIFADSSGNSLLWVKGTGATKISSGITFGDAKSMLHSSVTMTTTGTGSKTGTLATAPSSGDPTKWIPFDDNGTTRYIPAW